MRFGKVMLMAAGLFLISCGNQGQPHLERATTSEDATTKKEDATDVGAELGGIDFSLITLSGETISLSDYRGKTVVVNFWATWCKPCLMEMPDLNDVFNERKSELAVIGVTLESGEAEQVRAVVEEMNLDYPIVMGDETITAIFGEIVAFPTTFIVDTSGKITEKYIGSMNRKKLESLIGQRN